ncbi:LEA type 2 family protein [Bacteriovorax sp. PP10]|uniref:LEA type 2 family protein n=1 Tax=Bacteriovorax antarcticus TaxID=3088717 RepID=A0ABU5VSZ3_9BACT|nr:LEA type 2 family protein [Bacteriovorax sp. PP10]MEA9356116.1 LEA type 2 family protein [Bacteriovorax sp. PP10]
MKYHFLFVILLSVLFGCSSLKKVVEPPKVKLQEIHITKLSALNADLEIILSVKNPNSINFDVKNLKYALDINDKTVTSGTMKEKVLVKGKETTMVSVPLRVLYKDIFSSVLMLLQKDGVPYLVKGSVEVGPFTIPFDDKGNLRSGDL